MIDNVMPEWFRPREAAEYLGVEINHLVSRMHREGLILVVPGTEDPDCCNVSGFEHHELDCGCGFVASPHPDVRLHNQSN